MNKNLSSHKLLKDILNDNTLGISQSCSGSDRLVFSVSNSTIQNVKLGKRNILGIQFNDRGIEVRAAVEINNKEELQKVEKILLQSKGKTLEEIYHVVV